MSDKNKTYTYKMNDLVWAKMPSYCFWPGRVVEPNTPQIAKLKKSPSQHCVFFFGSNNYGWIEEKSLRPYNEFRDEMKAKGKPKDQFQQAMNDIESFIENPDGFSALFEKKTPVKKKASPKPKKQDIEFDFDSLKSDSSVPSSPNIAKTPVTPATPAPKRTEKPKIAEKTPKVPSVKRKATRESEAEDSLGQEAATPPVKKPRKSSQAPIPPPRRSESYPEPTRRSNIAEVTKQKSPRAHIDPPNTVFGFIGLGILGKSIVHNLLQTRHDVIIYNRTMSACDEFVQRYGSLCSVASTPKEVFEQAQITFVCVSDSIAVKETIIEGERGIHAAECSMFDKGLVMLSSIDYETSRDIHEALSIKGPIRYLEAQIQGSRSQAEEAKLMIIASGDKSLFNDCSSCFKAIANETRFLGEEIGTAVKINLILQTMAGVQIAAASEAFALADSFELQLRDITEIIEISNLKSNFIMEKCDVIIQEKFRNPSMKIDTMQKDLKMAIEFGDSLEQPLHLVTAANEIFKTAKRMALGQNDVASIYNASTLCVQSGMETNGI